MESGSFEGTAQGGKGARFLWSFEGGWLMDAKVAFDASYDGFHLREDLFSLESPYGVVTQPDQGEETPAHEEGAKRKAGANDARKKKKKAKLSSNFEPSAQERHLEVLGSLQNALQEAQKLLPTPKAACSQDRPPLDAEGGLNAWRELVSSFRHFGAEAAATVDLGGEWEDVQLFGGPVAHGGSTDRVIKLFESSLVVPKNCRFLWSDFSSIDLLLGDLPSGKFNLVVMDPPWENRSVHRAKKYESLPHFQLKKIPVRKLACGTGCIVAVWVTNKEKYRTFVREELFPHWGVEFVTEWHWLKVTNSGEPVLPLDSVHRRPYEPVLIGKVGECGIPDRQQTLVSVPGKHSRKPPLGALFEPYLDNPNRLELFARNLCAGWTSWGNEVLHFQDLQFFHPQSC